LCIAQSVSVSNELSQVGTASASGPVLLCIAGSAPGLPPMTMSRWSAPEASCKCTARYAPSSIRRLPRRAQPLGCVPLRSPRLAPPLCFHQVEQISWTEPWTTKESSLKRQPRFSIPTAMALGLPILRKLHSNQRRVGTRNRDRRYHPYQQ
jgi:hypothetical protein